MKFSGISIHRQMMKRYSKLQLTTSELIIAVIEKIRINISEEESRIVLGDHYRDSYLMAIRDFELCYKKTGEQTIWKKPLKLLKKAKWPVCLLPQGN